MNTRHPTFCCISFRSSSSSSFTSSFFPFSSSSTSTQKHHLTSLALGCVSAGLRGEQDSPRPISKYPSLEQGLDLGGEHLIQSGAFLKENSSSNQEPSSRKTAHPIRSLPQGG